MLNQWHFLYENSDYFMALEIEKKFLLSNNDWYDLIDSSTYFKQGYLNGAENSNNDLKSSVRIRIEGNKANINIKSMTLSITRQEYEYSIPLDDAEKMLEELCNQPLIEKTRHIVKYKGHKWEIDVFEGDNKGLIVAEIELKSEDEKFDIPSWIAEEVSSQEKYYNVCLVKNPYSKWNNS